jgi:hypothetical protein
MHSDGTVALDCNCACVLPKCLTMARVTESVITVLGKYHGRTTQHVHH